jgi:hypothetical protein
MAKMVCAVCGSDMNHHADKIDYSIPDASDPALGGVVQEIHTCPRCGNIETRRAE